MVPSTDAELPCTWDFSDWENHLTHVQCEMTYLEPDRENHKNVMTSKIFSPMVISQYTV